MALWPLITKNCFSGDAEFADNSSGYVYRHATTGLHRRKCFFQGADLAAQKYHLLQKLLAFAPPRFILDLASGNG
jgi:hypothetical protein